MSAKPKTIDAFPGQRYADYLLSQWAQWVKAESVGSGYHLMQYKKSLGRSLLVSEDDAMVIDGAIARLEQWAKRIIKTVYISNLHCDSASLTRAQRMFLDEFDGLEPQR